VHGVDRAQFRTIKPKYGTEAEENQTDCSQACERGPTRAIENSCGEKETSVNRTDETREEEGGV